MMRCTTAILIRSTGLRPRSHGVTLPIVEGAERNAALPIQRPAGARRHGQTNVSGRVAVRMDGLRPFREDFGDVGDLNIYGPS